MSEKILFVIDNILASTGVENMTISLANELCKKGYDISIIVLYHSTSSSYKVDDRVHLYALSSTFREKKKTILNLRCFLKTNKPDFLISVCAHIALITLPASIFLGIKNIIWEHFNFCQAGVIGKLLRLLSIIGGDQFITLTSADKKNYPFFLRNKITSIPNFISCSKKDDINRFEKDNIYVLSIGRYNIVKGFDMLLQAWAIVHKNFPIVKLKIVGERKGEAFYAQELKELSHKLHLDECVDFVPATKDIATYYKSAYCYVLSSRHEGFPMTLLEAKSFGLPAVCFDCSYGPSDIIDDGKDGLLVEPNNVGKLADAIMDLLGNKNKRDVMSTMSYKDYKERFNKGKVIDKWISLLRML